MSFWKMVRFLALCPPGHSSCLPFLFSFSFSLVLGGKLDRSFRVWFKRVNSCCSNPERDSSSRLFRSYDFSFRFPAYPFHGSVFLFLSRVADVSSLDPSQYKLSPLPSANGSCSRFHIGEPISIEWQAPRNHSRKDWIGIYRLGACKSQLVTRISSVGKWTPLYDGEYDGDLPVENPLDPVVLEVSNEMFEQGKVVLKGDALPWQSGQYELRYHHDG